MQKVKSAVGWGICFKSLLTLDSSTDRPVCVCMSYCKYQECKLHITLYTDTVVMMVDCYGNLVEQDAPSKWLDVYCDVKLTSLIKNNSNSNSTEKQQESSRCLSST